MMDISWKERLKYMGVGLLIIIIFINGIFEFRWLQNTLNAKTLLLVFAAIGATIGGIIGHLFAKKDKDVVNKMRLYLIFITTSILVLPIFGSLSNRIFSLSEVEIKKVELFEQNDYIADLGIMKEQELKPSGHFTFLIIDGKLERFKSKKILFPFAKKGDLVDLKMKKGLYGFWVVYLE